MTEEYLLTFILVFNAFERFVVWEISLSTDRLSLNQFHAGVFIIYWHWTFNRFGKLIIDQLSFLYESHWINKPALLCMNFQSFTELSIQPNLHFNSFSQLSLLRIHTSQQVIFTLLLKQWIHYFGFFDLRLFDSN